MLLCTRPNQALTTCGVVTSTCFSYLCSSTGRKSCGEVEQFVLHSTTCESRASFKPGSAPSPSAQAAIRSMLASCAVLPSPALVPSYPLSATLHGPGISPDPDLQDRSLWSPRPLCLCPGTGQARLCTCRGSSGAAPAALSLV